MTPWTTRPLRAPEAAILRHPDQRTPWAPSLVVHLGEPLAHAEATARLGALVAQHPILRARLAKDAWVCGAAPPQIEPLGDDLAHLRTRFDLAAGPPVRIALSADGHDLALVGHHAALDGRALTSIARCLLGSAPLGVAGPSTAPAEHAQARLDGEGSPRGGPSLAASPLRLLARPAHRVAPSVERPRSETFVSASLPSGTRLRVAPLAAATTAAAGAWNADRGAPWGRVGLTIPVGGPPVIGNVSTHRRLDLALPADVAGAVAAALATADPPLGATISRARGRVLRLAAPLARRLSDSLLVSNLGLVDLPGARAVDFYPQARGRSAVALGACTPVGGTPRLTLRARDLTESDARALLDAVVRLLE
ncbi:MAG: hypothetical protein PGN13_04130 [Patulibacter minatonensis]